MPQLQVTFRAGTLAQYNALQTKDEGCLYFITGKNMIFRGNVNVTSRYLISAVPASANPQGYQCIRLTDQLNGHTYDIPLLASVSGLLESNFVMRFTPRAISSNEDMLEQIHASTGNVASGIVEAGMVFRVELDKLDAELKLNPGQFATPDDLVAHGHDLVVALYDARDGLVIYDRETGNSGPWKLNHQVFTVIPTDLVDIVTAANTLDDNKVILGAGGHGIKAMPFAGANKVLRTNQNNDGVEWVTPETVANVVYWEDIDGE